MGILNRFFEEKRKDDGIRRAGLEARKTEESVQTRPSQAAEPKTGENGQKEQTLDEKLSILIEKSLEVLKEHAPEGPFHVTFGISESQNEGRLIFRMLRPEDWQLQIGANRAGSNMLVSHFLCHGELQTVLEYLSKPGLKEELVRSIKTLSASVDEKI